MTKRFEIGEHGEIKCYPLPSGLIQARGRYRGPDGVVRPLKASAPTERLAKMTWIKEMQSLCTTATGKKGTGLFRGSTVAELSELWIADKTISGVRPQTIATYRSVLRAQVIPRAHAWRADELTTPRLDELLAQVRADGRSTSDVRKVISQMCGFAVRRGVLTSNPIRDVTVHKKSDLEKENDKVVPFNSAYDVEAVFALIEAANERQRLKPGPNPTNDLRDFCLFMAGTGARPGEGLSLVWPDFNLLADKPYVDITSTLVFLKGRGYFRQALPKTEASNRRLFLPPMVVAMLLRRQTEQGENPLNAVFPARNGSWPSQSNYGTRFRDAMEGTPYDWVVFKTYRKTVLTEIKRRYGSQASADQAGHSDDKVTLRYYVPAEHEGPDATELISASVLGALDIRP